MNRHITEKDLQHFRAYLYEMGKSPAAIQKYMRDVKKLLKFSKGGIESKDVSDSERRV